MRTFLVIAATAITATGLLAVPTVAQSPTQTTFTVNAKVIPNIAGTPKNPRGIKIKASAKFSTPEGFERPILTHGHVLFPRLGAWNGGKYPKCTYAKLDSREHLNACPKGSIIGHAKATGYADTVVARADVTFVNGGQKVGFGFVTLFNPAFIEAVVPGRIQELKSRKWRYKVSFRIPPVLQIVAGIPIAPRDIRGTIGKDKIIVSTACPKSRRAPYRVKGFFDNGTDYTYNGTTACRPAPR